MSFLAKLQIYCSLFGWQGPGLALQTRLLRQPKEVTLRLPRLSHPVHLRLKTTDVPTFRKIFGDLEYDFDLVNAPSVIVDAGANLGFASVFFARKFPSARILAIEPETANFELLQKNVRPYANVTAIQAALWKQDTQLKLVDPGIGPWGYQARDAATNGAGTRTITTIQGRSVPSLMTEYGIHFVDLLKMDIEGGELDLFQDAPGWVDKVGAIMIELHDHIQSGCTKNFAEATKDFPHRERRGENVFVARAH